MPSADGLALAPLCDSPVVVAPRIVPKRVASSDPVNLSFTIAP